jgi:phosphoribosylaminoimidazole-succinocarboxamide synthase
MTHGTLLAEGKTKRIYAHPVATDLAMIVSKDDITAGDGARRHLIAGKGQISGRTTANNFALLRRHHIPTHFVAFGTHDDTMVVTRCDMIPLEVVTRRFATGSYLKRHPHISEGQRFDPLITEFFYKDDANHDPLMSMTALISAKIADEHTLLSMKSMAQNVFCILETAWAAHAVTLVDLKIEFGWTTAGALVVADVIDNDSWRIWQGGTKTAMLDKQVYRNMAHVDDAGLAHIKTNYETVMRLTDTWR